MRRTTVEVAGGMPRSDTVNVRKNTVSTGAFAVSMPQPDRPLQNDSWPGQLIGMQEMGGRRGCAWKHLHPAHPMLSPLQTQNTVTGLLKHTMEL
jgi:hypothetical protein